MSGVSNLSSRDLLMQGFTDPKTVETKPDVTKGVTVEERYGAASVARKAAIATILSSCQSGNCPAPSAPLGNPVDDGSGQKVQGDAQSVAQPVKKEEKQETQAAGTNLKVVIDSFDRSKEELKEVIQNRLNEDPFIDDSQDSANFKLADYITDDFVRKAKENEWDDDRIFDELCEKQQRFEAIRSDDGVDPFAEVDDFGEV